MRKNEPIVTALFLAFALICLAGSSGWAQQNGQQPGCLFDFFSRNSRGNFEVEVHFGGWSLNPIKAVFETELLDKLGSEIRQEIESVVRDTHPNVIRTIYDQSFSLDSDGSNFGLELRFFPLGREGAFSLGLALEKTRMHMMVQGEVTQRFQDGTFAEVETEGFIELSPFSTNLNFRWDMAPRWVVSPYFVFGFGVAPLKGTIGYNLRGVYTWSGTSELIEEDYEKTFREVEEETEINLPNIFVLLQFNFGVRAVLFEHLVLRGEVGVWDGFIFRVGIGFRY